MKVRVLQAISLECIVLMLYLNPWCTSFVVYKRVFQMACLEDPPRSLVYSPWIASYPWSGSGEPSQNP